MHVLDTYKVTTHTIRCYSPLLQCSAIPRNRIQHNTTTYKIIWCYTIKYGTNSLHLWLFLRIQQIINHELKSAMFTWYICAASTATQYYMVPMQMNLYPLHPTFSNCIQCRHYFFYWASRPWTFMLVHQYELVNLKIHIIFFHFHVAQTT